MGPSRLEEAMRNAATIMPGLVGFVREGFEGSMTWGKENLER
jgi:hypothetical protein